MTPFPPSQPTALRTAGLLAALALAGAAQASPVVVKIEDAGFTSGNNVIQTVQPGFGSSGPVTLNWNPTATADRALLNWLSGYSGRGVAYCGFTSTSTSVCALDLTVASGFSVTLDSFWFGSFNNLDRSVDWSVLDLDGLGTVASGPATAVVGATGTTITDGLGLTSNTGFRILFGNTGYFNGINDITYRFAPLAGPDPDPNAVSTPGSLALALAGLGVMGATVRRRRRA